MKTLLTTTLLLLSLSFYAQDAKEIIRKAEEKMRGKESAYTEMTIEVIRPKWTRTMGLKSWSRGNDYSLMVLTEPAKDAGTAFLKRHKEVWNWVPSIERSIKMPPSMMMQSWMGTDMSNDDLVRESSSVTDYTHALGKDSIIDGKKCWKVILTPKPDAAVVWGKVVAFVDQKDYVQLKAEQYDEDGYLVNEMLGSEVKEMDGVILATRLELIPIEKEGQKTIMTINTIKFNEVYDDAFFTVHNMKNIR
ncbi:MAG TPA: outer membrane lipoprotein-sorting protein [Flavobacteriales bacterium]|jgi:outer membrane lipoprotein-sorting protein|nr:outer membrane lipoprotein-sorting protein [Flavobacteriales bacterium]HAQ71810.1 outer membrane lipoprotein-sorting protein [Flavobacteriales bacterium]